MGKEWKIGKQTGKSGKNEKLEKRLKRGNSGIMKKNWIFEKGEDIEGSEGETGNGGKG